MRYLICRLLPFMLFLSCLCLLPTQAQAETIVWSGNPGALQADPVYGSPKQSLFPNSPSNNNVTVNSDTAEAIYGGFEKNNGDAEASHNIVGVSGGVSINNVYGSYAWSTSGSAITTGSNVSVSGGDVGYVFGGFARSDYSMAITTGNSVHISGGNVGDVKGSSAWSKYGMATATGNSVHISGGNITKHVFGGHAWSNTGMAIATGNNVILSGSPVFGASSGIFGGIGVGVGDFFSGNTLTLWDYTGSAVKRVENFQYYKFMLPASLQPFTTDSLALGSGPGSTVRRNSKRPRKQSAAVWKASA